MEHQVRRLLFQTQPLINPGVFLNVFLIFFTGLIGEKTALLNTLNLITTIAFTVEFAVNVLAEGLIWGPRTYLTDGWNQIDCLVVLSGIHTHTHTHTHTCTHMHTSVQMHTHTHTHAHKKTHTQRTCACVCLCVCSSLSLSLSFCVCVCACECVCVCVGLVYM